MGLSTALQHPQGNLTSYQLLLDYTTPKSDVLELTSTGSDGLAGLTEALDASKASFGYVRVKFANDVQSWREKFVCVVWIGEGCGFMRKAKVPTFTV